MKVTTTLTRDERREAVIDLLNAFANCAIGNGTLSLHDYSGSVIDALQTWAVRRGYQSTNYELTTCGMRWTCHEVRLPDERRVCVHDAEKRTQIDTKQMEVFG